MAHMSHTIAQIICNAKDTEFVYPYVKSTNKLMFHTTAVMQFIITTDKLTFFLPSIMNYIDNNDTVSNSFIWFHSKK